MAEQATSDCSSPATTESDDKEFDPSAEMMVNDFDDERTLEEEEGLSGDSCCNELDDLQKEGDMPLEDLLAMYGYGGEPQETRSSSEEEILSNQDLTLDKEEIARDLLKHDDTNNETSVTDLLDSVEVPSENSQTVRLLRSRSQAESSGDESDDEDYEPEKEDDWKKMIQVGSDYQAVVPIGLCKYGDAPAYENEDRLLWDPNILMDDSVERYLEKVHADHLQNAQGVAAIPTGNHVRDDEQALYLLLQCGHNIEEALRRQRMQSVPPTDPMSLWSEEECRNFENGLRVYGKDFHLIQQHKVRTRSVGELVQFYYLWKKTERHDAFANKYRLEKKKYILHPGITDYMDRFVDELENPLPPQQPRDRSSSPNIHSLLYGDHKRQHHHDNENSDDLVRHSDNNCRVTEFKPVSKTESTSRETLSRSKTDAETSSTIPDSTQRLLQPKTESESRSNGAEVSSSSGENTHHNSIDKTSSSTATATSGNENYEPNPKRMRLLIPDDTEPVSSSSSSDHQTMNNHVDELEINSTCLQTLADVRGVQELADVRGVQELADVRGVHVLADVPAMQELAEVPVVQELAEVPAVQELFNSNIDNSLVNEVVSTSTELGTISSTATITTTASPCKLLQQTVPPETVAQ
ncbi:mesoderm induction early response protein 1-like [Tubulanus polymorphus]|uniref:mesoderm induction early response protein 1-like n=1 Tax=Tubulanus polymorphus TaxID=672921 RepID=UPI003DA63812